MKKAISLILALLLCAALAAPALAAETDGGKCGDGLIWSLDEDGTLTVSGMGPMYDYSEDALPPWHAHRDKIASVVLGEGVTAIGAWAFYRCVVLTGAVIPDSVASIGERAFSMCRDLPGVTIPAGVASIGEKAFYACAGLTGVSVADGNPAYSSVDGVLFDAGRTILYTYPPAKAGDYRIPDGVAAIADGAFYRCRDLTGVTIPDGVASIGEGTFENCGSLTSVTIPASVSSIGDGAFYTCLSLADVYYGGSESQWEQLAMSGDANAELLAAAIHYDSAGPAPSAPGEGSDSAGAAGKEADKSTSPSASPAAINTPSGNNGAAGGQKSGVPLVLIIVLAAAAVAVVAVVLALKKKK